MFCSLYPQRLLHYQKNRIIIIIIGEKTSVSAQTNKPPFRGQQCPKTVKYLTTLDKKIEMNLNKCSQIHP